MVTECPKINKIVNQKTYDKNRITFVNKNIFTHTNSLTSLAFITVFHLKAFLPSGMGGKVGMATGKLSYHLEGEEGHWFHWKAFLPPGRGGKIGEATGKLPYYLEE